MHRYEELERLYYKKLFIKIFLIVLAIILGIGSLLFIYVNFFKIKKEIVKKEVIVENNNSLNHKEVKEIKKQKKNRIEVVNFILPEIKDDIETENEEVKSVKEIKQNSIKTSKNSIKVSKNLIEEKKVDVKYLIKKFNQNPSLDLALMIADEYLKENNLSEAKNWALKANNIAPQDERSWLIFADILIKQGNEKKAKEILNFYIDSYGKNDKIENKLRSLNAK